MQRLSSAATGVLKFVMMPMLLLVGVTGGLTQLFAGHVPVAFVALEVAVSLAVWGWCARYVFRMQRVDAGPEGLVIGGRRQVPFREIREVREFRWSNPRVITLELPDGPVYFFAKMMVGFATRSEAYEWIAARIGRGNVTSL